jgi:hypothetical protein
MRLINNTAFRGHRKSRNKSKNKPTPTIATVTRPIIATVTHPTESVIPTATATATATAMAPNSNGPYRPYRPSRPSPSTRPYSPYVPDDNFAYNPNDDIVDVVVPESKMTDEEFYTHYNPMGAPLNFSSSRGNDGHQPNRIFSFGLPGSSSKKRTKGKSHSSSTKQTKKQKKGGKSRRGKSRRGKSKGGKSRRGKSRRGKSRSI